MKFHSESIWPPRTQLVTCFINVQIARVDAKKGPNAAHIARGRKSRFVEMANATSRERERDFRPAISSYQWPDFQLAGSRQQTKWETGCCQHVLARCFYLSCSQSPRHTAIASSIQIYYSSLVGEEQGEEGINFKPNSSY